MECTRQTATAHLKALRDIGMMRVLEAGKIYILCECEANEISQRRKEIT